MNRILVIEDDQNIRETLSDLLLMMGYDVVQASNGKEGLMKARKESIGFILCDVNMPEMNGYEVLAALKKTDMLSFVPFIFLTAKTGMEELRTGMDLGADDYLTKPFTHESLEKALNSAQRKKHTLANQFNSLQNQLEEERSKLEEIKRINSHGVKGELSKIQGMIPFIKTGKFPLSQGLDILELSGKEIDKSINKINATVEDVKSTSQNAMKADQVINSIWLIDDDQTQNWIAKTMLHDVNPNWDIQSFTSPIEAQELVKNEKPDLILLDINMPLMSGLEFLEILSKTDLKTKIIMLSSSFLSSEIEKSLSYPHVINYWTKPLTEKNISELLNFGASNC